MHDPPIPDLASISDSDFRVSPRAYTDERIYRTELERIFGRTWIYLGHESEIPRRGDFKSTYIGQKPIFLIRDKAGLVRAFLNVCPHRGATLCRQEYGNSPILVCPYHAWSFKASGECLKIPGDERYSDQVRSSVQLEPVPRLEQYDELIFGCLDPDVQPLDSFLGEARFFIDAWLARAADGRFRVSPANKYAYAGNWKLQSENVVDGYHPQVVHSTAFSAMKSALEARQGSGPGDGPEGDRPGGQFSAFARKDVRDVGLTRGFRNGHASLEYGIMFESSKVTPEASRAWADRIREIHGDQRAPDILLNRSLLIFPNLALMDFLIRVWYPVAVDRTEIHSYALRNDGIDKTLDVGRMLDGQLQYSASGAVAPDDADIFAGIQSSAMSDLSQGLHFSRGLQHETIGEHGERIGAASDELPQRSFWRRWQAMMSDGPEEGEFRAGAVAGE